MLDLILLCSETFALMHVDVSQAENQVNQETSPTRMVSWLYGECQHFVREYRVASDAGHVP